MEFERVDDLSQLFPERKPEPPKQAPREITLETKEFHVVDPDTGEVVGYIDAPLTYCELLSCQHKVGKKHPMGFINPLDSRKDRRTLWVHEACLLPTRIWWAGQWRSMVRDGKVMPWECT